MANTKITNHIVDSTVITGQSAVTVADGDYILVSDASDSNALKKVLASDLIQSSEEVADIVGAMVSSNTESGITVAYQDSDNTIDFTIGTLNQNTTGSAATLTTARTIGGTSFDGSANIAVGLAATATALATSRTIHGVGFDGTANIDLSEVISDTVGAMFSSNTETNITVTYQDSDNTIDLVVDAAQPNVTSLGTLTTLTVDDITINGSTISDGADLTLDVEGNIVLDANGGGVYFKDDGTTIGFLQNDGGDFRMVSSVSDKDIKFLGNDGGSTITALTLDMSNAGRAVFNAGGTFNDHVYFGDNDKAIFGGGDDLQIYHDGSNSYIDEGGTGILYIRSNDVRLMKADGSETMLQADDDGAVNLFHNNALKLATTSTGTTTTGLHTSTTSANITQQALATSGTTISWNALTHANAYLVPAANLTIDNPSNSVEGAIISVEIAMNGTPRTIAWHTNFEFAASTAPTATATANKTDIFSFRYNGSVWQEIGRVQNMAQT